jgi:hypothetical protein
MTTDDFPMTDAEIKYATTGRALIRKSQIESIAQLGEIESKPKAPGTGETRTAAARTQSGEALGDQLDPPESETSGSATESRSRRVGIPQKLYQQLYAAFPDAGKRQTREANAITRQIIVSQFLKAKRDKYRTFSFSSKLMRAMYGRLQAGKVSRFLKDTSMVRIDRTHQCNRRCRRYRFCGGLTKSEKATSAPKDGDPHDTSVPVPVAGTGTGAGSLLLDCDLSGGVTDCEPEWVCRPSWRILGVSEMFTFDAGWRKEDFRRFAERSELLWPGSMDFHAHLQIGYDALTFRDVDMAKCIDMAGSVEKGEDWLQSWLSAKRGLATCFRKHGRVYHPVVYIPGELRKNFLTFGDEGYAEVDLKSTYLTICASFLSPSKCKSCLIEDLRTGRFYEIIGALLKRTKFISRQHLKKLIQKHVLFGVKDFGKTEIFQVVADRYPDLASTILAIRGKKYGSSYMSHMLTKCEGGMFVDGLLRWCVQQNIPAITIHDAVGVPATCAKVVATQAREIAEQQLGFEPVFDTKTYRAATNEIKKTNEQRAFVEAVAG